MKKPIDPATLALAERIADRLFTNGSAEHAQRLVLTVDRPVVRDLGGWSESAAIDHIYEILSEARAALQGKDSA